jgi:DNA polymerase-3 subunit beta
MKLNLDRTALLNALSHVQGVVERRTTIPILSNVLLDAAADGLSLTATDLDIAVIEHVPANVAQAGATTVHAHTLYDIVRKLPEGAEIELDNTGAEGRLKLRAGRANFQLSALPKDEFPVMAVGELAHRFQLAGHDLKRLIEKTRFAISTEETRYYLTGIYLHAAADGASSLRAVATDGHRLARVEMPLPAGAADMPGVIVPRKTINELYKLAEGESGEVAVALSDTKIRFSFDSIVLISKLIDGTFPDYERVIPAKNEKVMDVDAKGFERAVDLVSSIATEKTRAVKLNVDKERLVLSVTSPDQGVASEELGVSYAGPPVEIGFNARYLLDIAAQIEGETARFAMMDASSPTLVSDVGDDSALYVLMPMRV